MPDIVHQFPINASSDKVFAAISTPAGLDSWWTLNCRGNPELNAEYELSFGDGYDWHALVTRCDQNREFELTVTDADDDWIGTRLRFLLENVAGATEVDFSHTGWPEANKHYNVSCFCWAMYLRLMKRFVEFGEVVPYNDRLEV